MSLSESLAKKAMEYRMDDAQIRALGNMAFSKEEEDSFAVLLQHLEAESWDSGYDDAIMDTQVPRIPVGGL